jgi:hypothetical protein
MKNEGMTAGVNARNGLKKKFRTRNKLSASLPKNELFSPFKNEFHPDDALSRARYSFSESNWVYVVSSCKFCCWRTLAVDLRLNSNEFMDFFWFRTRLFLHRKTKIFFHILRIGVKVNKFTSFVRKQ